MNKSTDSHRADAGTGKPLAMRAIVYLAWLHIVFLALLTGIIIYLVAQAGAQRFDINGPELFVAIFIPLYLLFSVVFPAWILVMVSRRAATSITIVSMFSILFGVGGLMQIPILVLSLRRSVRDYCRGDSSHKAVFLRYKEQARAAHTPQTGGSSREGVYRSASDDRKSV
jgi:ABC-type transport system involved in multi-copper enzyme maturation permease subunit